MQIIVPQQSEIACLRREAAARIRVWEDSSMSRRAIGVAMGLWLVMARRPATVAAELRVGVGKRVITPDPLLPVSGDSVRPHHRARSAAN